MRIGAVTVAILVLSANCWSQTTRPTTAPMPAQQLLEQMLSRTSSSGARPLLPTSQPAIDATSGGAAVSPNALPQTVIREGTFLVDRVGRLTRTPDGQNWEFTLEADARAMQDPPLIVLPNLKLTGMEGALKGTNRDLRFRVTGMITEYNGRNYILIDKAVVPPDSTQTF